MTRCNPSRRTACRIAFAIALFCTLPAGCSDSGADAGGELGPSDELLKRKLDDALQFTYSQRMLNTNDHAAWQILHGALTYKRDFLVHHDGKPVSAVDHVLHGGYMKGWTVHPGTLGPRAILEQGTKTGQGHADQWLAVLAQCGLPPDEEIRVRGTTYTMADWIAQVQYDVSRNTQQEYSWTLIGLTSYLPTDAAWTSSDGHEWSIERLVQIEVSQDINMSACGGTHRLIGMSMALNQHLDQGGAIDGVWKQVENRIQNAISKTREFQDRDGGFSSHYFRRPGSSPDLANALSTTGHTLEFLTLSMTDDQLATPWVKRAVAFLCDVFAKTQDYDLECGALYHATHGLDLYRHRMFGPRRYGAAPEPGPATAEVNAPPVPP